jgi:uncharacterized protein (DUF4415 family)
MANDDDTVRYTAEEIEAMLARGEDRTDHDRLARMTDADIEAQAADEPEFDWTNVYPGIPPKKTQLTMRLDQDVVDWFKAQGSGYQTRINAVLRQYMGGHTTPNRN